MVLQKQLFPVPLLAGLDTKTDAFNVGPNSLLELENAVFDVPGRLTKRHGFNSLPSSLVSSQIKAGEALATYNNELLMFTGSNALSYSPTLNKWLPKGTAVSLICKKDQLVSNTNQQFSTTSALFQNYEIFAYVELDSSNNTSTRYTVIDHTTKIRIVDNGVLDDAGLQPQIIEFDDLVYLFYTTTNDTSTNLQYKIFDPASPLVLSTAHTLLTNLDALGPNYDWHTDDGYARLVFCKDDGYANYYAYQDLAGSPVFTAASEGGGRGVAITVDSSGLTWIVSSFGSEVIARAYSGSTLVSQGQVEVLSNVSRMAIHPWKNGVQVYYEVKPSDLNDTDLYKIRTAKIRRASTGTALNITDLKDFKRSVGLHSKPFLYLNSYYLITQHVSPLQSSYFIVNNEREIVARCLYEEGGKFVNPLYKTLCQVSIESGVAFCPVVNVGFDNVITGLSRLNIDFANNNSFIGTNAAGTHNIVGGIVQSYDNKQFVENNFLLYPEGVEIDASNGDGYLGVGTYLYSVVYKSVNNLKNPEYSTTSVPLSVSVSGHDNQVALTIPTLRLTLKDQVIVQVYRTEDSLSQVYYLVGEAMNDPSVDTITITDTTSDTDLIDNLPLYTTGGVIDNFAPPSCNIMAVCNNRVFVSGLEATNRINYSKLIANGFALEFAQEFTIDCDPFGGDITALGEIDGRLIIFKETAIFCLAGDGPNNFGQENDFRSPTLISSDVGCISANSVVKTDNGLMFQSDKGIYILNRSSQVEFIGAPVSRYNHLTITSAKLMEKVNQIRFTTNSVVIVFDYFVGKWSVFTNLGDLVDGENWNGSYLVLTSRGIVKRESNSWLDDGKYVSLKFTTAWLNPSTVQGYERVYRILLLGAYHSQHILNISLSYDYKDFNEQFLDFEGKDLITSERAYSEGEYGDGLYGGYAYPYQGRIHLTKQKCEAIKISVFDEPSADLLALLNNGGDLLINEEGDYLINPALENELAEEGRGYSISDLSLEFGIKQGGNKMRSRASFGTSG